MMHQKVYCSISPQVKKQPDKTIQTGDSEHKRTIDYNRWLLQTDSQWP